MRHIALLLALSAMAAAQSFTTTGSLNTLRAGAAAVLLATGKVLVIGGSNGNYNGAPLASAEIYDPANGTFTDTGSMAAARTDPQAVPLASGQVFVVSAGDAATELYDPGAGTFSTGPALPTTLDDPHAVLLPDGRVWITGIATGCQAPNCASPIEIYDSKSGAITAAGQLQVARGGETVTRLGTGDVLVAGGRAQNASLATSPTDVDEVCDPAAGCTSTSAGEIGMGAADAGAVTLRDGSALICGGNAHFVSAVTTCQRFDPSTQTFSPTTGVMAVGRLLPTMTLLSDGTVLVAGGRFSSGPDAEIYNPALGTFSSAGDFQTPRGQSLVPTPTATLLPKGTVLIAGGTAADGQTALAEAEIFTPTAPPPDFSISADETSTVVSTGSTATFKLTAHGAGGFSGTIALSCTGNGSTPCSFDPASVTPDASPGDSSTLTLGHLDPSVATPIRFQVVGVSGGLTHALDLTVVLLPANAVLSATSLSFGNQNVGTTSPSQTINFSHNGAPTLNLASITVSGDFAETDDCPTSFTNGAAPCHIQVTFTPTASGARTGTLSFNDNGLFSPQTVALSGTGTAAPAPSVTVAPASVGFGNQTDGSASAPQTVTVTNSGNADLDIKAVAASGDFSETDTCSGAVAAGKSCTVAVTFKPDSSGNKTGALTFTDNAGNSPQTVALSGTGTAAPAPSVALAPSALTFASQTVGLASAAQAVTVTNSGTATLTLNAMTAGGDFAETNNCGTAIEAGKSCSVSVTFNPSATGNRSGQLQVSDNAGGSPQAVSLQGTGIAAAPAGVTMQTANGAPATATVAAGKAASYGLDMSATGNFSGTVTLSCSGAPTGAACALSPASFALGSTPVPVSVTVTTTAASSALPPPGDGSAPLWPWAGLVLVLGGGLLLWAPRRRWVLVSGLELALVFGLAACGGSPTTAGGSAAASPPPPTTPAPVSTATPAGDYTLTITADANGAAIGSTNLTLVVQ